jgi:demethylmenaquinone methyltransferase/2-methoxy-6-polyprenyl-1,4-benzoquinol methylase
MKPETGKKDLVRRMFNSIAWRYDFLNHFLSLGVDKIWRKKAVSKLNRIKGQLILDVACGTADLAIELSNHHPDKVIGIDLSEEMLGIGNKKIEKLNLKDVIELSLGDSENLSYQDKYFDAVTVGFGVRNFENLEAGINEMYRVLKNEGELVVLEFSKPYRFPVKQLYYFYFKMVLPFIGRVFSNDKNAYSYLPNSVMKFPDGKRFTEVLEKSGFTNCQYNELSFGICTVYHAIKEE